MSSPPTNTSLADPKGISAAFLFGICVFTAFYLDHFFVVIVLALIPVFIIQRATNINTDLINNSIYLLLILVILAPPFQITDSIPKIRPEQILFLTVIPLLAVSRINQATISKETHLFLKFFVAFQVLQLISLIYGKYFHGVTTGYKDLVEIIRVSQYLVVIYFISSLKFNDDDIRSFLSFIILLSVASAAIGIFQYFGLLNLDRITAPLYFEGRVHDVYERIMGTFYNPNTYGTFISVALIISIGYFSLAKSTANKLLVIIAVPILGATLALSQSRTALITFIVGLITLFAITDSKKGSLFSRLLAVFMILIFSVGTVLFFSEDISARFETLLNFTEDPSWIMRIYAWYLNLQLFFESPILGLGPAFHQYTPTVDSEYILILRRYGVVGLCTYLFFYIIPIKTALIRKKSGTAVRGYNRIFIAASVIFLIGNITNPLFHEMQFIAFWAVLTGILFGINKPERS